MPKPIENPLFPLNYVIKHFYEQTLEQIDVNLMTQKIWPNEIYEGYAIKNEANKRDNLPHSTGEGAKSFRGKIVSADKAGNVTLVFSFNHYMRYAELGVGTGVKAENVERDKNVKYTSRYISVWDRSQGSSHRPAIMAELRHLQSRIRDYLVDFYGYEGQVEFVQTLDLGKEIRIL